MWRRFLKIEFLGFDVLNLFFVSLLLLLTLLFWPKIPEAFDLSLTYIGLLGLILICSLFPVDMQNRLSLVHLFYPFILVPTIFESLGKLIIYVHPRLYDPLLARLDKLICGQYPCFLFDKYAHPLITSILQLAYISYYFMPLGLGLILLIKKDKRFYKIAFGLLLGFYTSYIGYLLIPALGPRYYLDPPNAIYQGTHLAKEIADFLNKIEKNKTDAFPSGHTQISLMCTYYAALLGTKWGMIYGIFTALLIISTIYCRYHYVVDVLAGALLAIICLKTSPPLEKAFKRLGNQIAHFFRPN